jgi:hypothetical protein
MTVILLLLFFISIKMQFTMACVKKIGEWKYDGYQSLLSDKPTLLCREEVTGWFGSKEQFIKFHDQPVQLKKIDIELNL